MAKLLIQKEDAALIESLFTWEGGVYSVKFVGYEDTIWSSSLSGIYLALYQFKKFGKVATDENSEVVSGS